MKPIEPIKLQKRVMPTTIVTDPDFVGVSPMCAPKFSVAELRRMYQDKNNDWKGPSR